MTSFISDFFGKPSAGSTPGHGGARRNAGAKTKDEKESGDYAQYQKAKTRTEEAKASMAELELAKSMGEVVLRAAVVDANAKAFAAIAQACRTIPDILERQFALPPAQVEKVSEMIDAHLGELAEALRKVNEGHSERH